MRKLRIQRKSAIVQAVIALCVWFGVNGELVYAQTGISPSNRLLAKLQTSETIKVIVTARDQAHNRQISSRYAVVDTGPSLLDRYKNPKKLKLIREFKRLPQSVYQVDAAGLQELLEDPNVSVHENRIARASLAQSVKRIYPSQKFSPYHGDNDWVVAVIDSGVNSNHPMLVGKVVSEACYSTTDTSALDADQHYFSLCPGGAQSSVASGSAQDCSLSIEGCGHGTAMAGIAVGNGAGRLGVAKDGKIISLKTVSQTSDFDNCDNAPCAVHFEEDLLLALDRVLVLSSSFKIAAVNMSLNFDVLAADGTCDGDPLKPAIDMLRDEGIVTVISAGNDSENTLRSPSCISTSFSVGATLDTSDTLWEVSSELGTNRSRNMDLFAPGANITTATGSSYATVNGTSASAAHVSGAWVAARHAWPTASVGQLENLIRSKGPVVFSDSGQSKRRLDLTAILDSIDPGSQDNPNPVPLTAVYLLLLEDE